MTSPAAAAKAKVIAAKLLHLAAVVLGVTLLTFLALDSLPLDAAAEVAGAHATAAEAAAASEKLGLDRPVLLRYGEWLAMLSRGELGRSLITGQPVTEAIAAALPVTLELLLLAQAMALAAALPAGILTARKPGSLFDRLLGSAAFTAASIPPFALALFLVFVFSLRLKWLPATGFTPLSDGIAENIRGLVLPAASIAVAESVMLMRALRSDLIATLREEFILLARAQGLPPRRILLDHALRNSCFTLLAILGLQIGSLIGGSIIVETLFSLPGLGRLLVGGIFAQDFPVVQGCVLVISVGYVTVNSVADICHRLLDPRLRPERGGA